MLNDPPPEKKRRQHPLERQEDEAPQKAKASNAQRVMLHIPVVKPNVTYALIAINIVIFIVMYFGVSTAELNRITDWGANNQTGVLENGEFHRLVTAMFMHGGIAHIVFNMMALYFIGQTVERFFGHVRFAIVYLLGGLLGSVLSIVLNGPSVYSVGASGAVFAIVGAEIVFLYKHRKLLGEVGQAQLRQLLIIAGLNFAVGFGSSFTAGQVQIDNWGHVGGFIGGLVLAWFIGPFFSLKRHPARENALTTEDVNPLENHFQTVVLYISALLALLIAASLLLG